MNLIQKIEVLWHSTSVAPSSVAQERARAPPEDHRPSWCSLSFLFSPFFERVSGHSDAFASFCCIKNQSKISLWFVATLARPCFPTQSYRTRNSLTNIIFAIFGEGAARRVDGGCKRTGAKWTHRALEVLMHCYNLSIHTAAFKLWY